VERENVIRWLRILGPAELADLLYEVWGDWPRAPTDYYEPNHMPTGLSRFAVAEVRYWDGWLERQELPTCMISLVARSDEATPDSGAENLQSGECRCKARLVCWAKDAVCPGCGSSCYLT
jgi:hypothetical protein